MQAPAIPDRLSSRNALLLASLLRKVSSSDVIQKANASPATHEEPQPTLSQIYRLYLDDPRHKRCPRTVASYETTGRWASEFFGAATPLRQITRSQCRAFVDFLQRVPKNAQKRFPHLSLIEAAKLTVDSSIERINEANVNAYVNKFAGALNWAEQEGFIERNPVRGLGVADPVKKRDKRFPFSVDQLRQIFHSPIFTGCVNDEKGYSLVGPNLPRRSRYWVPLIGLLSGLRLNEICQLEVADMVVIDGVLCFIVREGGVNGGEGKRIKSSASERVVPVHAELGRLGFDAYVAARRVAGGAKLFPDVAVGSTGYHSKCFSQWFGRFLVSCDAKQPLTCFHSFRHNFRDGLRASGASRDLALALGGWARSSAHSDVADVYGSGFPAANLKTAVDGVDFHWALGHLHAPSKAV